MPGINTALRDRAREVRIEDEIVRRGITLKRSGAELIGPCPKCGGEDRFAVNLNKQVFNCRGCNARGALDQAKAVAAVAAVEPQCARYLDRSEFGQRRRNILVDADLKRLAISGVQASEGLRKLLSK